MTDERLMEVYRQLREAQNKYTYFILAIASAAVAFAVNQTNEAILTWSQIPLGVAVALWALSFLCGCRHLAYVSSTLYSNAELLLVQTGEHSLTGSNSELIKAVSEGILDAINSNISRANSLARWQFGLLVMGGVFYVVWHILEMYIRALSLPT